MIATKHWLYLLLAFLLSCYSAKAQQCGNCKEIPKIAGFGFDIKVPEPDKAAGTENLWPEWKNLFMIASVVATKISNKEGACIRMTVPPAVDTGDVEIVSVGGETFVNLPSNPLLSPDLSTYGNYLLTGSIWNTGTNCQLRVEVQSACNRKPVVETQISFSLTSLAGNVSTIAEQIASQFYPLAEKIKNFELKERMQSPQLSLHSIGWDPIIVSPQKRTLKTGESTSFTIEVKDCDGKPLAGREVFFNESSFDGMKIPGTTGGSVDPGKVITDANGMAKATFTLNNANTEVFIAAHSPGKDVKGCNSILFGDAPINIKYTYSGFVTYTYEGSSGLMSDKKDATISYFYTGDEKTSISYRASFYGEGGGGDVSVSSAGDETDGTEIPDLLETGTYKYKKSDYWKNTVICNCAGKGDVTEQKLKANSAGELKKSNINFSYNEGAGRINLDLFFNTTSSSLFRATLLPTQSSTSEDELHWSVNFDTFMDKNLTVKKEKVGNKTRYTIEGEQTIKVNQTNQSGKIKMVVWEE